MKKVLGILLALTLIFSLISGCSNNGDKISDGSGAANSNASEIIGSDAQASGTEAVVAEGDVKTGYYNLADYESQSGKKISGYKEAPMLTEKVNSGTLPPLEKRLPENPLVMRTLDKVGTYGGTLRVDSINIDQDWHLRHLNADNLIEMPADSAWDPVSTVFGIPRQPGILEKYEMSKDGTVFSGTIRKGIKWSDGEPVTTDDVSFCINDIYLNKELNPVAPDWLTWGGGKTELKVIDQYSFEIRFAKPYGAFVEAYLTLWPASANRLMLPKHYLTKYHKAYASEEEVMKYLKEDKYTAIDEWPAFFNKKVNLFGVDAIKMDNGKVIPSLKPWIITKDLGNGNYLLERNPYYYMVDQEGNQLPYIDKVNRTFVANEEMANMSIISGKVDVSCMSLNVQNFPLYKEHENDGNYLAMPLNAWQDQIFIAGFNMQAGVPPLKLKSISQNTETKAPDKSSYDPGLADVYGDLRFRQAMSVALDRKTMNETLFMGLGRPAQVAPRKGTPFYKDGMEESYAQYDPELAKKLLDEMGMKDADGDGWRERPDGKPFNMKFEYFVITGASTPGAEFCKRYWEDVGVRTTLKLVDANYWWSNLQPNNLNETTTWWLSGSGANLLQGWFLGPTMLTPLYNNYTSYKGQVSDEDWQTILKYVPEWQREMQDLRIQLKSEPDQQKRIEIGTRMWELQAEYLPIIGVATDTKSPLVISKDIGNVEMAPERNYNYITVMEQADQMFFKNPERLK